MLLGVCLATVLLWPKLATAAARSLCDAEHGWSVAWQDEFDAAALNRSIWAIPVGVGSSLGREANVTEEDTYVQDGMLVLRSRALPGGKRWTTGAAITNQRNYKTAPPGYVGISWQYGRFCVRAKLPGGGPGKSAGLWPAHWMMPADYSKHCGYCELDIMEMVDGDGEAHGTQDTTRPATHTMSHYGKIAQRIPVPLCEGTYWYWGPDGGGPAGSNCSGKPVRAGSGSVKVPDYWTTFHEYAIEWTPKKLTFFVDQKPYKSYSDPAMLPQNNHFMMLNSAVGGSWPGEPNAATMFPAHHYIDYVRVSQRAEYEAI
eukprot:COSAG02_NODE_37_length_48203_cov_57.745708_20_plen_315_part_00